ncbi:MAG: hypothetical protein H0Z39_10985 [Peptococcaceae bacterium]|nr:hypothetical protein [Peptococcaceae bacterium]
MLIARLEMGNKSGRLCFDGQRTFLAEWTAEEIVQAVAPFLDRELTYKTSKWVDGHKVKEVCTAAPNTLEHFSALVWHYLPHKAGVKITFVGPDGTD